MPFTRSFQAPGSRSTLSGCSTWVESKLRRSQPRSRIRPTSSTDGLSTDARAGVAFWTSGTGIDGENPVEIDELDLVLIDPLPSHVWYQDMADFAEGISDTDAARHLSLSLQGRGAFRRFKNQVYEHHPGLISVWHAFRDVRAQRRAVEWLLDQGLIDDGAADRFAADHPDPRLP